MKITNPRIQRRTTTLARTPSPRSVRIQRAHLPRALTLAALSLIATSYTTSTPAQTPQLTKRGTEEYRSIADVRELSNGRVLISDTEAGTIWSVAADGKRTNAISSGSIQAPGRFRALGADSTLIFSRGNTKFIIITPDGALTAAPSSLTPPDGPTRIGVTSDLYATNGLGDLYWTNTQRGSESMPILKRGIDGATSTVATLRTPPTRVSGEGGIRITMTVPFAPVDEWEIADNGDVIIARGEPYRIDRVLPNGTIVTGKSRTYDGVPITSADKDQLNRERQRSMGSINLGGVALNAGVPDDAWPKTKPAFGRSAIRVAPDGLVWVKRYVAADASVTLYDVFLKDGSFREAITLPANAEVVGFGAGAVFVSIRNATGDRYTLHTMPR